MKKYLFIIIGTIIAFSTFYLFANTQLNCFDLISEYGMTHALINGEIPYVDFNTVVPPFFYFFYAPFLLIYDDIIVVLLVTSVLIAVSYYLLYKVLDKKWLMMIPICSFFLFILYIPTYNYLSFFLIVLLIYLEHYKKNDYLIGVVLALLLFTKHTIGLPIIVMSFLSIRNFNRIKKRTISILSVSLLFLIYFLLTSSLYSFLDLCVFGLFDFASNSRYISIFVILIVVSMCLYLIYKIIKTDSFVYYYALGSVTFVVPLLDILHFSYFFSLFFFAILYNYKLNKKNLKKYYMIFASLCFIILFANIDYRVPFYKNAKVFSENHFSFYLFDKKTINTFNKINDIYKQYDNIYLLSGNNVLHDIINDKKITYYDVLLHGNFGYNGHEKMIKRFNDTHGVYYYCLNYSKKSVGQYDYQFVEYVREHSEFVSNNKYGVIYYKK